MTWARDGADLQPHDDDYYTLRRYQDFRAAAGYVAEASRVSAVRRFALFGSVALPPRLESGDEDEATFTSRRTSIWPYGSMTPSTL